MKRILIIVAVLNLMLPLVKADEVNPRPELTEKQKKMIRKLNENGRGNRRDKKFALDRIEDARGLRREIEASGYEIVGYLSLEESILRHIERRDSLGADAVELNGMGQSKLKNMAILMTVEQAASQYADMCVYALRGRLIHDLIGNTPIVDEGLDRCKTAYARAVYKKIKGLLKPTFSIRKSLPEGWNETWSAFLFDEKEAMHIRQSAIEEAIEEVNKETELPQSDIDLLRQGAATPIYNRLTE